jgi:outer membrane biosynthesis protein TonB
MMMLVCTNSFLKMLCTYTVRTLYIIRNTMCIHCNHLNLRPPLSRDIALLLFQIKIQTKMSGSRRRGRAATGAEQDDEEGPSGLQKRGKSAVSTKVRKDAAGAETAAEIAAAEVESLAAEAVSAAASKPKQPQPAPAPSKPAPVRNENETTAQERQRIVEKNRKEKEVQQAQEQRDAEHRRHADEVKKLRQNKSKPRSSESKSPKEGQEHLSVPRKTGECNF